MAALYHGALSPPARYNGHMTTSEAFDLARSLHYQAQAIRREATSLDSTASYIMVRYGDPADAATVTAPIPI